MYFFEEKTTVVIIANLKCISWKQNIFTHWKSHFTTACTAHSVRILIAPSAMYSRYFIHNTEGYRTTSFFHGLFLSLDRDFFRFAGFNGVTNPGATSSQQQQLTAARPAPVAQLGVAVRSSQLSGQSAVRNSQPSSQPFTAFRHAVATSIMHRL